MDVFLFVLGAILGSAANAIIDRLPKKVSWLKGRSMCDHCHHVLSWKDLIPLVSYILLKGRCRYCGAKIPWRNFLVELLMGLGFVALSGSYVLMAIYWVTVVIAVMDWETKLVSELFVVLWLCAVLASKFPVNNLINWPTAWGILVSLGLIGGIWALTRGRGMGFGDVEIAGVMGLWLGWPRITVGIEMAFILGAVVGILQILRKKNQMKGQIAFGTFLVMGSWIAYFWGDTILKALYG